MQDILVLQNLYELLQGLRGEHLRQEYEYASGSGLHRVVSVNELCGFINGLNEDNIVHVGIGGMNGTRY